MGEKTNDATPHEQREREATPQGGDRILCCFSFSPCFSVSINCITMRELLVGCIFVFEILNEFMYSQYTTYLYFSIHHLEQLNLSSDVDDKLKLMFNEHL